MGVAARAAATTMAAASTAARNIALMALARRLRGETGALKSANEKDLAAARAAGLAETMVDRLKLT
ncbi:MAG: gamma-glutamyl-phosphate reductase, partial [Rhizobacter sp.]